MSLEIVKTIVEIGVILGGLLWGTAVAWTKLSSRKADDRDDPLAKMQKQIDDLHRWHNHPLDDVDGEVMNWWVTKEHRKSLGNLVEGQAEQTEVLRDLVKAVGDD